MVSSCHGACSKNWSKSRLTYLFTRQGGFRNSFHFSEAVIPTPACEARSLHPAVWPA